MLTAIFKVMFLTLGHIENVKPQGWIMKDFKNGSSIPVVKWLFNVLNFTLKHYVLN